MNQIILKKSSWLMKFVLLHKFLSITNMQYYATIFDEENNEEEMNFFDKVLAMIYSVWWEQPPFRDVCTFTKAFFSAVFKLILFLFVISFFVYTLIINDPFFDYGKILLDLGIFSVVVGFITVIFYKTIKFLAGLQFPNRNTLAVSNVFSHYIESKKKYICKTIKLEDGENS